MVTCTDIVCAGSESVVITGTDIRNNVLVTYTDMLRAGSERVSWLLAQTFYVLVLRVS